MKKKLLLCAGLVFVGGSILGMKDLSFYAGKGGKFIEAILTDGDCSHRLTIFEDGTEIGCTDGPDGAMDILVPHKERFLRSAIRKYKKSKKKKDKKD